MENTEQREKQVEVIDGVEHFYYAGDTLLQIEG